MDKFGLKSVPYRFLLNFLELYLGGLLDAFARLGKDI